jgi:hypothetical protein
MTRHVRSWAIAALAVFALAGASAPSFAGIILSSNMNAIGGDDFGFTNTNWSAAPFRTTSELTRLTDVTLDIYDGGEYAGGNLSVEIWTASNAGPTAFMQSILASSFSTQPVSITGLSVMLQPNTDYAVVARGNVFDSYEDEGTRDGALRWTAVTDTSHTGDGFVSGFWYSIDSGSSWNTDSRYTVKMSVLASASAVPEIDPATGGTALSLVAGVLAMIEQRRRRATLVASSTGI